MPLNKKGMKIKSAMMKEYGAKKGKQVFYASENKGTIKSVKKGSKKTYLHGSGDMMGHETVMKKVGAMGMMGDKHMMDAESMAKMKKQMPMMGKGMM